VNKKWILGYLAILNAREGFSKFGGWQLVYPAFVNAAI
jgi:hypothetical protein